MKMFDASPWGSPRMGQFNPFPGAGSPYSWNVPSSPPGAFYGGTPFAPEARVLQRAEAEMAPPPAGGGYLPQAIAAEECFTCTNPDSGDTKYGVPAAQAKDLKSKGYKCRKDNCARPEGGYGQFGSFGGGFFAPPTPIVQGMNVPPSDTGTYSMLEGRRSVPLVPGIGTRAFA